MNDRRDVERRLETFTIPPPGDLVRARALAAGREAARGGPGTDVWERIWASNFFRLVWALSVVALAAGHLMLPRGSKAHDTAPRYVERVLGTEASDELVAGLLLPPVDPATLPQWGGVTGTNENDGEMRNE